MTTPLIINQILADLLNEPESLIIPAYNMGPFLALAVLELILIYNDHHYRSMGTGYRPDDHDLIWQIMLMQDPNGTNHASFVRNGAMKQAIFLDFFRSSLKDDFEPFEKAVIDKLELKALVEIPLSSCRSNSINAGIRTTR